MKQDSNNGGPRLMTVKEAAEWLRTSPNTIYAQIAKGELPVVPTGLSKGYRVDVRDLEQFINQRRFRCVARAVKSSTYQPRHIRT
jgi:excisionase family DNA binding protein